MDKSERGAADLGTGPDPGIPTLHTVLGPETMAEHLRRILPQRCGSVREVRTQILKRHRTRCTFEIQWRAGNAWRSVVGKVYGADRPDVFRAMDAVRRAGFGPDETFSIPEPLAYAPELRLLLLEKVTGPRVKEVILTGAQSERVAAAEHCAHWLARYQTIGPRLGEPCRVDDVLDSVEKWSQPCAAVGGALAERVNRLREQLEVAAGRLDPGGLCPAHGHFTSGQVLVTEGAPVLIESALALGLTGMEVLAGDRTVAFDWDDATVADPCRDAASFVVHLLRLGWEHPESRTALQQAAGVFLKTYLSGPRRKAGGNLPFYAAARCLRLASRDVEKDVTAKATVMVDEGLRILKQGLSSRIRP